MVKGINAVASAVNAFDTEVPAFDCNFSPERSDPIG